jgi:hypothetical protein
MQPWQDNSVLADKKKAWNAATKTEADALATTANIQRIIGKSKLNGAPGLDGIQYGALKLLLHEDAEVAKKVNFLEGMKATPNPNIESPILIFLTNLTNAILSAPLLPRHLTYAC